MFKVAIKGTGSYLPDYKLSNHDLFQHVKNFDITKAKESLEKRGLDVDKKTDADIFDIWVQRVTGIKNRHYYNPPGKESENGEVEDMALHASLKAIEDAGINKDEIDAVIFATFTSKTLIPNPSCSLTDLLGISNVAGITINTACSGFLDGLLDAVAKISSGIYDTILVASSEYITKELSYDDPTTAILFGDGAAAAIVQKSDQEKIFSVFSQTNFSKEHITMQVCEKLKMGGGPLVQRKAVNAMYQSAAVACEKVSMNFDDFDFIIPHQANHRIIKELASKMKIPGDKMIESIQEIGNISCATIPLTLDLLRKNKLPYKYTPGSKILCTSVGGGYTYGAAAFEL